MLRHVGSNMETVRRNNRAMIAKYINDNGPASRKDISKAVGLTAAALTQISGNMMEEGILEEVGVHAQSKGAGRKQILLDIAYSNFYVLAINIDSQETVIALSDLKGRVVDKREFKDCKYTPAEDFLKKIAAACKEMCYEISAGDGNMEDSQEKDSVENVQAREKIVAVGVSVPGMVDSEQGISIKAYGVWDAEVRVRDILEKELPYPVFVEKNVNALAAAEQYYGIGKDYNHLMLIKWGPGVGCAMVIDQKIYEGRHNRAAELGHFIVEPNGKQCSCGKKGCLETRISYAALQEIKAFDEADFGKMVEENPQFTEAIDLFARSIVNSATMIAPDRVVLTGPLFADEGVRTKLIVCCEQYDEAFHDKRILYSPLADRSDYMGPVASCAKNLLFS